MCFDAHFSSHIIRNLIKFTNVDHLHLEGCGGGLQKFTVLLITWNLFFNISIYAYVQRGLRLQKYNFNEPSQSLSCLSGSVRGHFPSCSSAVSGKLYDRSVTRTRDLQIGSTMHLILPWPHHVLEAHVLWIWKTIWSDATAFDIGSISRWTLFEYLSLLATTGVHSVILKTHFVFVWVLAMQSCSKGSGQSSVLAFNQLHWTYEDKQRF